MAQKKGPFAKHANRVVNRVSERARTLVTLARSGNYDQTQMAKDIGGSIMDVVDFWRSLFGSPASPALPVVLLGPKTEQAWRSAGGETKTVLLEDPVPDDAVWPVGGGGPPLLQLRPVDGGTPVSLDLQSVTIVDDDGIELKVTVRSTRANNANPIPAGEYWGNLYYILPISESRSRPTILRGRHPRDRRVGFSASRHVARVGG